MNKLCKTSMIALMIIMIVAIMTLQVNATTGLENLIDFISSSHEVKGEKFQLDNHQIARITTYLQNNKEKKVATNGKTIEENADLILTKLKEIENLINNSKYNKISEASIEQVNYIKDLIIETGKLADVEVTVDTTRISSEIVKIQLKFGDEVMTFTYDGSIKQTVSEESKKADTEQSTTTKKLVYTGKDNSFVIKLSLAIVAIAIMSGIIVKKYAK